MKNKLHTGARTILGLAFIVFGLNGFFQFMPNPPMSTEATDLLGALAKTGYFFPMIKIIELLAGVLLLANFFAPFAAILLTPILVGITTIHIFLNPAGLPMMILLHVLHGFIAYGYMSTYRHVLVSKAEPFQ